MKSWYLSKTIWVNLLTLLVGLLGYPLGLEFIQNHQVLVFALIATQGALNIVLRFLTRLPVGK